MSSPPHGPPFRTWDLPSCVFTHHHPVALDQGPPASFLACELSRERHIMIMGLSRVLRTAQMHTHTAFCLSVDALTHLIRQCLSPCEAAGTIEAEQVTRNREMQVLSSRACSASSRAGTGCCLCDTLTKQLIQRRLSRQITAHELRGLKAPGMTVPHRTLEPAVRGLDLAQVCEHECAGECECRRMGLR